MNQNRLFTIYRLGTIGALAILLIVLTLATGSIIMMITGIPSSGFIVTAIIYSLIFILLKLLIPKFGSALVFTIVLSLLILPTPVGGPPGFLPKLLPGPIFGLLWDLGFILSKNKKVASLTSPIIAFVPSLIVMALAYKFFLNDVDKANQFIKFLPALVIGGSLEGILGGYLGYKTYHKIKNRKIILKIRGEH